MTTVHQSLSSRCCRPVAWLVVAIAATFADVAPADDISSLPDAPYTAVRSDPVTHTVDFRVIVTAPYHCQLLKVWLPVPQSDAAQEVGPSEFTTFPASFEPELHQEPVYGNRFAYFEFPKPQGAQIIQHRFTAKVWNLNWSVDPAQVAEPDSWPIEFAPYLQPQPVDSQREFDEVLSELRAGGAGGTRLAAALDWVDAHLTYDHIEASLQADANHAFSLRRGHCSDYHGLCATFGRSLGYPSRVTYGIALVPRNSPSHCKLEFFLPGHGWVSYDVSETQKLIAAIHASKELTDAEKENYSKLARQRLHRGFRENSWLLVTRGTNYELAPPATGPVPVVRTIYAEADGIPLADPDPANRELQSFSWMTSHRYEADRPFDMPFTDWRTLIDADR
jgi:hypothetical protein